jgi:hypothetical protein
MGAQEASNCGEEHGERHHGWPSIAGVPLGSL